MASKIIVNLDTSKDTFILAKCKQNDDLTLEASIYENGLAKDLTNCSIIMQALKADNTFIVQNDNINKSQNKITSNLIRDFTRMPGTTKIEIVLTDSSKQNTTFSFCLEVVASVINNAVESKNGITTLEELKEKLEAIQVENVSAGLNTKELKDANGKAEANISGLKAENTKAATNINSLKDENSKATANINNLTTKNTEAASNINTLTTKTNEAKKVKEETEQLIENGSAATKGDIKEVNVQLVNTQQQINNIVEQAGNPEAVSAEIAQARGTHKVLNERFIEIEDSIKNEKQLIYQANEDYLGNKHDTLKERLNEDFNNVHQKINDSSLLPYEGTNITANNSYYGLVKDLSIKGRTLNNLVNYSDGISLGYATASNSVYSLTYGNDVNKYFVRVQPYKTLIKPDTVYTLIVDVLYNDTGKPLVASTYETLCAFFGSPNVINMGSDLGIKKIKLTSKSDLSKVPSGILHFCLDNYGDGTKKVQFKFMLLEGDYTNTPLSDLPFVEGIKSVGETEGNKIIVKSCGKNLFDNSKIENISYSNSLMYILNTGAPTFPKTLNNISRGIGNIVKVKPNTTYTLSYDNISSNLGCGVGFYSKKEDCNTFEKALGRNSSITNSSNKLTFTTPEGANYIVAGIVILYKFANEGGAVTLDSIPNIQIEEGTVETEYQPYQESEIEYQLGEPLRSLPNGVCDSIENNKVIRRVGKVILNGSEDWIDVTAQLPIHTNTKVYHFSKYDWAKLNSDKNFISDKFKSYSTSALNNLDVEGVTITPDSYMRISIEKTKLTTQDMIAFKSWLKQNPTTVYYELATPIATKIEMPILKSFDRATHITSNNSLLPTISAKVYSDVITALDIRHSTIKNKLFGSADERVEELEKDSYFPITNLINNGDFSKGTSSWLTTANNTLSAVNNAMSVSGNGIDNYIYIYQSINEKINHKYYARATVKANIISPVIVSLRRTVTNFASVSSPTLGMEYILSGIYTATTDSLGASHNVRADYSNNSQTSTATLNILNFIEIDLTETFGLGNEPTKEEMDKILSFYPNGWFDGTLNLADNGKILKFLLNEIRSKAKIKQEEWIEPTLLNGFVNIEGLKTRYRKLTNGVVYIEINVNGTQSNKPIFILPQNYRPAASLIVTASMNNLFGNILIADNGGVYHNSGALTNIKSVFSFSI